MPIPRPVSHCPICGDNVVGRSDKIYCSDKCKAVYHQRRKLQSESMTKIVDAILHRNWVLLQELHEETETKKFFITKSKLLKVGFKFEYHTTSHLNKDGKMYHYVYNYGWMDFSEKEVMIVRLTKPK